jgi:hypothetical protein
MRTAGEKIRDAMIENGTEDLNFLVKAVTVLESSRAGGSTIFKASRDFMRIDKVCFGLCLVSTPCKGVAILSSTCKFVPCRKTVWLSSKAASQCIMRYINITAGFILEIRFPRSSSVI